MEYQKKFEYENNFYLTADTSRFAKLIAQYELYKKITNLHGAIVECGVFKGASLMRWLAFRDILENQFARKIIAFDIFGKFPETNYHDDYTYRKQFIEEAGDQSISLNELTRILEMKGQNRNVKLIEGDICKTVPEYVKNYPELRIALLNLDTDIYEPATTILDKMWPLIVPGGILILDDYGVFPGETKAVDEYFQNKIKIKQFPYGTSLSYIIKE